MRGFTFASVCFVMLTTTGLASAWPAHSGRPNGSWYWAAQRTQSVAPPQVPIVTPTQAPTPVATTAPTPVPTQAPTPPPVALHCTDGSFSAPNAYPDSCYRPYAANSVWNTPIDNTATLDPKSTAYVSYYAGSSTFFQSIQFGYVNQANEYHHPIYFGRASDPQYKVSCTASYADCKFGAQTWHIPSFAVPAGGTDHHLGVVDQTNNDELSCWDTDPLSGIGGTLVAGTCTHDLVTGAGINGQATGAGFSLWAGVIRAQELIAGNIPHALFIVAPCTSNDTVYPSIWRTADTLCPGGNGAPYGARMRLNMSDAEIAASGASRDEKTIMTALAHRGGYIADTNGNNGFGLSVEADTMYVAAGYRNPACPTNGAPCTPLTAYFHSEGDPGWTGDRYSFGLTHVDWAKSLQFLAPPTP